jgi:hypothetical protein
MLIRFGLTAPDLERLVGVERVMLILAELLRAHRFGMHLLVIERSLVDYLLSSGHLSGSDDKAMLNKMRSEFTQTGHLHEIAAIYIEITPPETTLQCYKNCVKIPIDQIDLEMFGNPALLLTEDANGDGEIIEFILGNIRDIVSAPRSRFKREHGGGTSTLKRLRKALEAKELGTCVVDTDRITPFSKFSEMVKEATDLSSESGWPLFVVLPLPCHEVENLIPHDVLALLECARESELESLALKIFDLERRERWPCEVSFWLFVDLKNGLSSDKVATLDATESKWIYERMAAVGARPGDSWNYSDMVIMYCVS